MTGIPPVPGDPPVLVLEPPVAFAPPLVVAPPVEFEVAAPAAAPPVAGSVCVPAPPSDVPPTEEFPPLAVPPLEFWLLPVTAVPVAPQPEATKPISAMRVNDANEVGLKFIFSDPLEGIYLVPGEQCVSLGAAGGFLHGHSNSFSTWSWEHIEPQLTSAQKLVDCKLTPPFQISNPVKMFVKYQLFCIFAGYLLSASLINKFRSKPNDRIGPWCL